VEVGMCKVTLGICALVERRGVDQLIRKAFREGVDEIILVTPNAHLAEEVKKANCNVKIINEDRRRGKSAAVNEIFRNSSGDIIIMASADIEIKNGAITRLLKRITSDENLGMVDSHVILKNRKNKFFTSVVNSTWLLHNLTMIELSDKDRLAHVAGDLYVIKRGIINKIPECIVNDDAFIAMIARLKGYRVLHEPTAICYILGPQNPYDYVLQRSRVLYGHFQILKYFGRPPTTFQFAIINKPLTAMSIMKKAVKRLRIKGILHLLIASFLEVLSILYLMIFFVLIGKKPIIWRVATTTKEDFN
jgi:cellulose synthase/poly-beta-1,6-N-acetylglucosamine synthase-like glycosyltransferase